MSSTSLKNAPIVDSPSVTETYVTGFLPSFTDGLTANMTMTVTRMVPKSGGVRVEKAVVSRLVMSVETFHAMKAEIDGLLEKLRNAGAAKRDAPN